MMVCIGRSGTTGFTSFGVAFPALATFVLATASLLGTAILATGLPHAAQGTLRGAAPAAATGAFFSRPAGGHVRLVGGNDGGRISASRLRG